MIISLKIASPSARDTIKHAGDGQEPCRRGVLIFKSLLQEQTG
jgi:hypothetical protein